jgi:hypothetical protein
MQQLLREQLSLERERRESDREWFESQVREFHKSIDLRVGQGVNALESLIREDRFVQSDEFKRLGEKLDALYEIAGVPHGETPTIEELISEAKSDNAKRKLLQSTLAELEFSDTEIEY